MKLHLGCGDVHLDGWVNVDRRYQPGVDRVENIGILQHYPLGGVDEIYSCHAIDHFDRWSYKTVLKRWFDLIRPGGVLRISMPDFGWTVMHYQRTRDLSSLIGQLYAGQDYEANTRHWIWDRSTAIADLCGVGFSAVEDFTPFANDASRFTDALGNFRSLNLVAKKRAP